MVDSNTPLLEIPNYFNGKFEKEGERKILFDYQGKPYASIFNASSSSLRSAKRNLFYCRQRLHEIPLEKIIAVLKRAMDYYYVDQRELEVIAHLTGSPLSFLKQSFDELKDWCRHIEEYLHLCFGYHTYELVPIQHLGITYGYRQYVPRGPIVGILPKNSEAEAAYLLIQIILSKNPALVKASSSLGSSFSSICFIQALQKAIQDFNDDQLFVLLESLAIVNLFDDDKLSIIKKLEIDHGVYVIFGSNKTLESVDQELQDTHVQRIIKLGTGLSASVVLDDADLDFSAKEICHAASLNKGNDCISTNVVYVSSLIYESFFSKLSDAAKSYKSLDPFHEESVIGIVEKNVVHDVVQRIHTMNKGHLLYHEDGKIHLSLLEMEDHERVEEFPAPILMVRKVDDEKHLLERFLLDLQLNGMKKNLATSIFTQNRKKFESLAKYLPSHIVKLNKGTEKMNLMLQHQSLYLLQEFLDSKILEIPPV